MTTDLVVVGSGGAGLAAALAAALAGARATVLERAAVIGGTTAVSGGGMWLPGNRFMAERGSRTIPTTSSPTSSTSPSAGCPGPATSRTTPRPPGSPIPRGQHRDRVRAPTPPTTRTSSRAAPRAAARWRWALRQSRLGSGRTSCAGLRARRDEPDRHREQQAGGWEVGQHGTDGCRSSPSASPPESSAAAAPRRCLLEASSSRTSPRHRSPGARPDRARRPRGRGRVRTRGARRAPGRPPRRRARQRGFEWNRRSSTTSWRRPWRRR